LRLHISNLKSLIFGTVLAEISQKDHIYNMISLETGIAIGVI